MAVALTLSAMDELWGYSVAHIAKRTGASLPTVRRWRALKKLPALAARLVRVLVGGELEPVDPAFKRWRIHNGELHSPEGWRFSPGEILSIPFMRAQISTYQSKLRFSLQADWIEGKHVFPDETQAGPNAELFRQPYEPLIPDKKRRA